MSENEAIKELKEDYNELGKAIPCDTGWGVAINEAYSIAIKALEEIQEYRAIGTVEEFKALKDINRIADNLSKMERIEFKALKEKNEPKKVKTNKYLVGDRVVYIGNSLDFKGKMGTIIRLAEKHGQEYDQVKFDDPYFIDSDGCKYYDYFCFAKNLQKIDKQ